MQPTALFRTGPGPVREAENLGLLAGLQGRWHGSGFNMILLPDFDRNPPSTGPQLFRPLINATTELLDVVPIGAPVPNRGSEVTGHRSQGQDDINLFGLRYLQHVSDANTHEPLHIEPGFWLNVPPTTIPQQGPTIVRQGAIPHGTSIVLQGTAATMQSPPQIPVLNVPSLVKPVPPVTLPPLGYLEPYTLATLPPPFTATPQIKANPNLVLQQAIASFQDYITETTVLQVSSTPGGGVVNIPFLQNPVNNNAAVTEVTAIFWLEHVVPPKGVAYDVLQYSQVVIMNFVGIDWPHVSVATLYRQ